MVDNKAINEACDNNDSLDSFKVCELKNYLREHGQNITGKKSELNLRMKGVNKWVKYPWQRSKKNGNSIFSCASAQIYLQDFIWTNTKEDSNKIECATSKGFP